jgi:hypothetical protein
MPLFQFLFEVSLRAPLQARTALSQQQAAGQQLAPLCAAWLQHGVNTAAMGTSARQLRTAGLRFSDPGRRIPDSRPYRLTLGHIDAPPFPD